MKRLMPLLLSASTTILPCFAMNELQSDAVHWTHWNAAAFQQAKTEHKLVLLDLGAVWCYWCHVMDKRTYGNPSVAKYINAHFVAIKEDQDERPDLNGRYGDYGWPATIILDANGKDLVKHSGSMLPEDFLSLLKSTVKNPKPDEEESAQIGAGIKDANQPALSKSVREELSKRHVKGYDNENGAWAFNSKYLDLNSFEYALLQARAGDAEERSRARKSLDAQMQLLDPVWGGMAQCSSQGDWHHPHFEKLMPIQSDNLKAYSDGYAFFKDPKYLHVAELQYKFLTERLLSPDGAFYTSEDNSIGGKSNDEYFKMSEAQRLKLGVPNIDKHIYARDNGWAIDAIVRLYKATGNPECLATAKRAAEWIVSKRKLSEGGFKHGDNDAAGPYLADSLYMGRALLSLYEVTADRKWLNLAEETAKFIDTHFKQSNGLPGYLPSQPAPNAVQQPKPVLDENVDAARFFNMLARYTGSDAIKTQAQTAMRFVAIPAVANQHKFFVGGVLLADHEMNSDPLHITVFGGKTDPAAHALFMAAWRYPLVYKQVEWLDKAEPQANATVQFPKSDQAQIIACTEQRCSRPVLTPQSVDKEIDALLAH